MRGWQRAAAAAAALTACGAAPAATAPAEAPVPADGYYEIVAPVAPHVWVIRQQAPFHLQPIGNVTIVEQKDGLVLIDSGGSPGSGRRIARLVRSVSAKPVKAVMITHWHGDHSLGLSALHAAWPAMQVIATVETDAHLTGDSMARYAKDAPDPAASAAFGAALAPVVADFRARAADAARPLAERAGYAQAVRELAVYRGDMDGAFIVRPTRTFADRLTLPDPVAPVVMLHPGRANTDGDAAAWLPRQRVLVTGDIVIAPVPFGYGSYPASWVRVLGALRHYPFRVLVPGHGAPQRDRLYLDRLVAALDDVQAQARRLAAAGATLDEARRRIDFAAVRRSFVGDDPWRGRWFDLYWAAPIAEDAWKEARGIPIEQGRG